MSWLLICLIVFLAALNAFATVRVVARNDLQPRQMLFQAFLIWLAPLVGAIICLLASSAEGQDPNRDPNYRPPDEPWDSPLF